MKLAKNIKSGFLSKKFWYNVIFYQILMLFKFLRISYVFFYIGSILSLSFQEKHSVTEKRGCHKLAQRQRIALHQIF